MLSENIYVGILKIGVIIQVIGSSPELFFVRFEINLIKHVTYLIQSW